MSWIEILSLKGGFSFSCPTRYQRAQTQKMYWKTQGTSPYMVIIILV